MIIIVFLIAFVASTVGAITGMGGGVIIKPVLDAFQLFPAEQIGIYSSATVFSMAVASLIRNIIKKVEIDYILGVKIFIGSTLGGFIGSSLLEIVKDNTNAVETVTIIQSSTLIFFLGLSALLIRFKDNLNIAYFNKNVLPVFLGLMLGTIASFLSIGGGPINVAFIAVLLGFDIKEAALYSILTIFFSQFTSLGMNAIKGGFSEISPLYLTFMAVGGVLGGLIGTKVGRKVNQDTLKIVYYITLLVVVLINIYVIYINIL